MHNNSGQEGLVKLVIGFIDAVNGFKQDRDDKIHVMNNVHRQPIIAVLHICKLDEFEIKIKR